MEDILAPNIIKAVVASPYIERDWRAFYSRLSGKDITSIRKELGYQSNEAVYAALDAVLGTIPAGDVEKHRKLEESRLDSLQDALWGRALAGEVKAINLVLRIMEQRAQLLGLNAPIRIVSTSLNLKGLIFHMEGGDGSTLRQDSG